MDGEYDNLHLLNGIPDARTSIIYASRKAFGIIERVTLTTIYYDREQYTLVFRRPRPFYHIEKAASAIQSIPYLISSNSIDFRKFGPLI